MAAWFQRDICGCTARRRCSSLQGTNFRMRFARSFVPPFTHDMTIAHQYAAYAGIGCSCIKSALCQLQRSRHPPTVCVIQHAYFQFSL